ncbi:extensin family protein [Sorangium sp. So ce1024]|uniref:extensin family protein n=1 Tax=Sorangium sp. So ce1024 TaxID=3133327 RepID=UPI003F0DA7ED
MAFSRLRCLLKPLACALLASAAVLSPAPASAGSPFLVTPEASVAEASPAYRYANMTNEEALAELDRRKILYLKVDHAPGVRAPIRLTGRLNGVHIRSVLPPEQRVTSVFEILDARLALALDDFAALLARHDIDEVVHYTMYRPNMPMPGRGGAGDAHEHKHAAAPAAAAGSAARKGTPKPAPAVGLGKKGTLDATSKAREETPRSAPAVDLGEKGAPDAASKAHEETPRSAPVVDLGEKGAPDAASNEPVETPRSAPVVDLGEKGTLDAASKAPEERPRPVKEKGAAETAAKKGAAKEKGGAGAAPKEKGAGAAASKEKSAAKAAPGEKSAAAAAPKDKGTAKAAPGEKSAAAAAPKDKGTAKAAPKEKGAAEAVAKKDAAGAVAKKGAAAAAPKEKGAAGAAPKDKATTAATPKEKGAAESARSAAPGDRPQATAARSAPAKGAGKAGGRRVALREPVGSTRATASSSKRRAEVTPRSGEAQKPRGKWAPPGTRHPAGLAIDVGALKKRDGTWMSVARHFHGRLGDKTCGAGAPQPELPEARELRSIVCEAADLGIFTYVLTPNYDAPHADHFHMEIKPGVRWFLYH